MPVIFDSRLDWRQSERVFYSVLTVQLVSLGPGLAALYTMVVIVIVARNSVTQTASLQCFSVTLSERYGFVVTAFAARRVDVSHIGVPGRNTINGCNFFLL